MPYSFTYYKEEVKEWFVQNVPTSKRILDVGPGIGTYSDLLRSKGYRIDAVEIYEPYIDKYKLRTKYDNVYVGDILTFDISDYDFIIMGDVLEHISKYDAVYLINKMINAVKEILVAVPYEMEQGEHEGNIHETHHQPDLTHEMMGTRYPELTSIYRNEYYGYYTYTLSKADKMYILYANASYYNTVCAAVDSINKVSNIPVTVYMLNDHREVPGANTVYWEANIKDLAKNDYIDRNDSSVYKLLIQRPLIVKHALDNLAKTVCYVDSDSVATQYIDTIFDYYPINSKYPYFTQGIYDYLFINGRGGTTIAKSLEYPACQLFNIKLTAAKRGHYRQTGYFISGQNTIDFLDEWTWMCNHPEILRNPQYYAPYHEETIANVLLWKYEYFSGLPYIYTNASFDKLNQIYEQDNWGNLIEPWFQLPKNKEQLLFLHGEKDPVVMSKIMSKLPSKMSKPLKIMFLAPHLSTGGMPQFLLKRIEALQKHSDVEIFVVEHQCHSLDFVVQRDKIKKISRLSTLYEDKMELFQIIENFNPDVIHIDEMSERLDRQMITKLYSEDRKYRIVETCHDVSFVPETKMFIPDAFAFCSPYHLDTFTNVEGYKEVIEYPIDDKTMYDKLMAQDHFGLNTDKKHVVNIGLWTKGKNQGEALEVARQLPDVEFHFIGNQAGNFKDYWEPLMKDIPKNVNIWGERHDTKDFLMAADLFMFNSTWECNPLVVREAISYGLPIIARDLPQYKDMFTRYIINLNPSKLSNQIKSALKAPMKYDVPTDNTHEVFGKNHANLYEKAMSVIPHKNDIYDYNIIQNFVGQPFLEITGTSDSTFDVEFYDLDEDKLIHYDTIKCNHWIKLSREYYTKWETRVYKDGVLVYTNVLDYTDKRVYISFDSSSLGDTIAWIPYILEFQKKHNCKVIVSTFKNFLFESVYPELEFVAPGTVVNNIYGMYKIGWFYDSNKEPVLPNTIPLQQTATNILGLEYREIKPNIVSRHEKFNGKKYVTIATNSTAGCKFWTKEAWQEVINYLVLQDYNVINVSLEENPFDNCTQPGNKSMEYTMEYIANSAFFIGLSSGLSWLAWALNKEVIMISNFTEANHEFSCIRPINTNVCHGCWNDPQYKFDKGDWNWCPSHKGTDRQFECQTSITADMIIEQIKTLI